MGIRSAAACRELRFDLQPRPLPRLAVADPVPQARDVPSDDRHASKQHLMLISQVVARSNRMLFDRPAFYTPIHAESNLGDFKQAITDTIQALGTGIWKARDGHVICPDCLTAAAKGQGLTHQGAGRRESAGKIAGAVR